MMTGESPEELRAYASRNIIAQLDVRPFINNNFVDAHGGDLLQVRDPMTQAVLTEQPLADASDIDGAVSAARAAFDTGPWSSLHPRERGRLLLRLSALIEDNHDDIALLESLDAGKRLAGTSAWDISNAAEVYRYYAGWADKLSGSTLPSPGGVDIFTRLEPVGVVAAIIPWNFPFPCIAWKVGPALAAGCTVVIKPPERAPLSAQYFAQLVLEAGFPPGVVNVVMGTGEVAGRALVADSRVDKITFTGEAATAQDIMRSSLHKFPRVTFELGDKTPNVVLEDADLDAAVPAAVGAAFGVSGQNCCAASRVLVQDSIADIFTERFASMAAQRRLGDPLDTETDQGPQIDLEHVAVIDSYVKRAVKDGAKCATGGQRADVGDQFYLPTVLTNTNSSMQINREEVFGPVTTIMTFADLDEAIALANDRDFGLAAAIWTSNHAAADRFAARVRTGTCWINTYEYFDTVAPWGGRNLSGIGRELGEDGIRQFLESKTIVRAF